MQNYPRRDLRKWSLGCSWGVKLVSTSYLSHTAESPEDISIEGFSQLVNWRLPPPSSMIAEGTALRYRGI